MERKGCDEEEKEGKYADRKGADDDCKGGKEDDPSFPAVSVSNIEIEPNMCPLAHPLSLVMDFHVDDSIVNAYWEVKV